MTEATQATDSEAQTIMEPLEPTVDLYAKAKALSVLLNSYERHDLKAIAKEANLDFITMSRALPAAYAQSLVTDMLGTLSNPTNPGQFVVCAIESIGALANAIVAMTTGVEAKTLDKLIQQMADYSNAESGSAAEILADQGLQITIDEINETMLSVSKHLYAGFVDDDDGFVTSAGIAFIDAFEDEDEEDEDDLDGEADDEDDGPTLNG